MGMLNIKMWGSFPESDKMFEAQKSGHAVAVDDAIRYLKETALPAALENDKGCRKDGALPDDRFEEARKRNLLA